MKQRSMMVLVVLIALTVPAWSGEKVDLQMMSQIRSEGLSNSQVMELLSYITDVHGPRLTGSEGIKVSSEWCREKLESWGLVNSSIEPWGEFGRGWSLRKFSMSMTEPYYSPLIAFPEAWTSGTNGVVSGTPILIKASSEEELEVLKGRLKGAIVMIATDREAETHFEPDAERRTAEELEELAMAPEPGARSPWASRRAEYQKRRQFRQKLDQFLRDEGVKAILKASRGEHGTIFVSGGGSRDPKEAPALPSVMVSIEHFLRLARLIEKDIKPVVELQVEAEFHSEDLQAYNVIAEIPGTDPQLKDQLVMLGGHIDSWHSAPGAADNAVGVAVTMEALRILQELGVKPRRTIRIALWSAEEQGLLGSRAYVKKHFADPEKMELLPEHKNLSAYFNLDNGTGKVRGVYLQGNAAVRPIFEDWLRPFHDLGAQTLTMRNTGGTDHLAFDAVGLPGFQFIQDPIDYSTRIHHTNMDAWDHVLAGDVMQASVIMAAFVYNASMRDEMLPRKALPEARPQRSR